MLQCRQAVMRPMGQQAGRRCEEAAKKPAKRRGEATNVHHTHTPHTQTGQRWHSTASFHCRCRGGWLAGCGGRVGGEWSLKQATIESLGIRCLACEYMSACSRVSKGHSNKGTTPFTAQHTYTAHTNLHAIKPHGRGQYRQHCYRGCCACP